MIQHYPKSVSVELILKNLHDQAAAFVANRDKCEVETISLDEILHLADIAWKTKTPLDALATVRIGCHPEIVVSFDAHGNIDTYGFDRLYGENGTATAIKNAKKICDASQIYCKATALGIWLLMLVSMNVKSAVVDGIDYSYENRSLNRAKIIDGQEHAVVEIPEIMTSYSYGEDYAFTSIGTYNPDSGWGYYGLSELGECELILPACIQSRWETSFANGSNRKRYGVYYCGRSKFKSIFFKGDVPEINWYAYSFHEDSDYLADTTIYYVEGNKSWEGMTKYYGGEVKIGAAAAEILPNKQYIQFGIDQIELTCVNSNATYYYTLDGSAPTAKETTTCHKYTTPFTINEKTCIKAIAVVPTYKYTVVTEKTYEAKVSTPEIVSEQEGTYYLPQFVSMSCSTDDATIRYTTNGTAVTTSSTIYKGPFVIDTSMLIIARAFKTGWTASDQSAVNYVRSWYVVANPTIETDETGDFYLPMTISILCDTSNAIVRYTIDGTSVMDDSPIYNKPFRISETTTVRVKAFKENWSNSVEVVQSFTRKWYTAETPVVSAAAEIFDTVSQEVTLSCATEGATIYYTIDGSDPSATNGRVYKGPFDIYQTTTVKAIAVKDDWKDSAVASATFTKANEVGPAINMLEVLPDNDKTHPWTVVNDVTHDGVSAVKSGEIEDEESTTLKVTVYGAGELSFWWKTSCEPSIDGEYYDYATFYNGSTAITNLAGVTDWQRVVRSVEGTGKHTFKWTYQKDGSGSTVPDAYGSIKYSGYQRRMTGIQTTRSQPKHR